MSYGGMETLICPSCKQPHMRLNMGRHIVEAHPAFAYALLVMCVEFYTEIKSREANKP